MQVNRALAAEKFTAGYRRKNGTELEHRYFVRASFTVPADLTGAKRVRAPRKIGEVDADVQTTRAFALHP